MTYDEIKIGDKVHYRNPQSFGGGAENGVVKSVREDGAFVVYHCDGKWHDFDNYTGQHTPLEALYPGWK